ncbi:major facilitator superfamily domain-containing protein [Protomyces lactucae-debilis]|uniref:Major facilitator superfamily domain-containing protein n=1 Tax=Protomyces lactucae-debilis TaxID=2754530 RepID=A0A1Y2FM75_PROLT|nr:major facilitator superfamily domain-containing protein [Protomyces lactucae-debilis]ORY83875.1 major facilitator superfamily domain-containing protein [Protomyces lactucae-debilis]
MGRYQWSLWTLCGFGWLADQMLLQMLALIQTQAQADLGYSTTKAGGITSCYFAGLAIGASFWGIMSDVWGRKPAFLCTLSTAGLFAIFLGAQANYAGLCAMAALMGTGTGGNLPLDGAIFLEASPGNVQRMLMLLSVFWSIGQLIASLVAWGFIGYPVDQSWRYTCYTLGCIVIFMFICRFLFPFEESPKNLLANGKPTQAIANLNKIAKLNKRPERIEIGDLNLTENSLGSKSFSGTDVTTMDILRANFRDFDFQRVKSLFATKKMAATTIIVWLLWIFIQVGYSSFNAFLPRYLQEKGVGAGKTIDETYLEYVIISVCGLPGSFLALVMVEIPYVGRKGTMAIGAAVGAASLALFAKLKSSGGQLAAACIQSFIQNGLFYAVLYAYSPEVFPTAVRGTAVGLASMLARVFAVWVPVSTGALLEVSTDLPLIIAAVFFGLLVPLSLALPIETKGRQAL